ncbi:MAG: hypothetical protein P8Z78_14325 [Gammaproteobacteria bacterium]|jgi:predicted permease
MSNKERPAEPVRDSGENNRTGEQRVLLLAEHEALCSLVKTLQETNRRWQIIVFPAMFAFILLAGFGFYLIYNLVEDVDKMANSVYLNMGFMADRMGQISQNLDALTGTVGDISVNLDDLTATVTTMNVTLGTINGQMEVLPPMLTVVESMGSNLTSMDAQLGSLTTNVQAMNSHMAVMTETTQHINANVGGLNHSISRPMNFMNKRMPW